MTRSKTKKRLKFNLFLNKPPVFWLLILIILVGFLLRLYNLPNLFYYTMDEEVMNLIQRRIVLGEHFPLIGSVSPLGTYLGPIFYYFGALILWISNLNPLGQGIFASILGGFNILLIYFVAKTLFNTKTGILAAIFYAFSFLMVIFDRRYWHLTPGPILSLLVLLSIYKIKQGKIKFVYLLTGALIFGWNTDYTNLVLFLFTVLAWIIFRLPLRRKEVLIAIVIFLLSNIPLIAFDLRHDFLNSKAFVSYFTTKHTLQQVEGGTVADREAIGQSREDQVIQTALLPFITFSRAIYTASDLNITEQHTYCRQYIFDRNKAQGIILPFVSAVIIAFFVFLVWNKRKSKESFNFQLILSFYLIFQLGVTFYAFFFKGDVFEHYLATLMPYLFIMLGVVVGVIYSSKFKIVAIFSILAFILVNLILIKNAYNPFGYKDKMQAAKYALSKVGDNQYSLDTLSSCYRWDGFYYPFILQGPHPVKSYQDPNYSWLYNYKIAEKHPGRVVVVVPKGKFEDQKFNETYNRYQKWIIDRMQFNGLEVLILDNSKGDFN